MDALEAQRVGDEERQLQRLDGEVLADFECFGELGHHSIKAAVDGLEGIIYLLDFLLDPDHPPVGVRVVLRCGAIDLVDLEAEASQPKNAVFVVGLLATQPDSGGMVSVESQLDLAPEGADVELIVVSHGHGFLI